MSAAVIHHAARQRRQREAVIAAIVPEPVPRIANNEELVAEARVYAELRAEQQTTTDLRARLAAEQQTSLSKQETIASLQAQLHEEQASRQVEKELREKAEVEKARLDMKLQSARRKATAAEEEEKKWKDECNGLKEELLVANQKGRLIQTKMEKTRRKRHNEQVVHTNLEKMLRAQVLELSQEATTLNKANIDLQKELNAVLKNENDSIEAARRNFSSDLKELNESSQKPLSERARQAAFGFGEDLGDFFEKVGLIK